MTRVGFDLLTDAHICEADGIWASSEGQLKQLFGQDRVARIVADNSPAREVKSLCVVVDENQIEQLVERIRAVKGYLPQGVK